MGSVPIDWVVLQLNGRRVQAGALLLDDGLGIPAEALSPVNVVVHRFLVWRRRIRLANGPIRRTSHALKRIKDKNKREGLRIFS